MALGRRIVEGLALAVALLMPSVSGAAPPDAPSDREIAQLERLAEGTLPPGASLQQLLRIDASDRQEVADLRADLEKRVARIPASAKGDAAARSRALELRLQFLDLPDALRAALVTIDRNRQALLLEFENAQAALAEADSAHKAADEGLAEAIRLSEGAETAADRFATGERVRAATVRRDQAKFAADLARRRSDLLLRAASRDAELMRARAGLVEEESRAAADLFDECVSALIEARGTLKAALEDTRRPVEVPRYAPPETLPDDAAVRSEISGIATDLHAAADQLAERARLLRHEAVEFAYHRVQTLNESRIVLLDVLPAARRERVLGFGAEGRAQLRRELEHLELQVAWYRYARANLGIAWSLVTGDTTRVLAALWDLAVFAFVCALAVYLGRNATTYLEQSRVAVMRLLPGRVYRAATLGVLEFAERLRMELLLVAIALLAPWALGGLYELPEIKLVHTLFWCFTLYRLLLSALYEAIEWLTESRAGLPKPVRDKTLRSLHWVGRYLLATVIVLAVSADVLGRGYLYLVVANIWWIGGLPIAAVLLRWWQPDIVETYLAYRSTGVMADAVRATRDRWYGFFVAVAAVAILFALAVARLTARFAMGFEQTRRALAYLFRRRLERHAEGQSGPAETPQLPEALERVLAEGRVEDPRLLIDHYPGLEEFIAAARAWGDGGAPAPTLLVGDTGYGKTTWLQAAAEALREAGLDARVLTPPGRITGTPGLVNWLAAELKAGSVDSVAAFTDRLEKMERTVILIDDGQLLFSRALGGFEAWDTLAGLAGTDSTPILWAVAVARYPFEYLNWAHQGVIAPFRHVRQLKPWTDAEIAELLRARTRAGGVRVIYDDLIVDRNVGRQRHLKLLRTENEYARLIWDYAEGCPRTALRCWRASLVPAGPTAVRVRLFRRPPVERLDRLTLRERFVLAALVWHQTLTVQETVSALRYPAGFCEDTLAVLRELGIVLERDGVFRLESDWLQPARRLLRREHLVPG